MIRKFEIIVAERSSVVRPPRSKVRVEVPHPSEKYMKSFGEHGVRRSVREISHLCLKTHITWQSLWWQLQQPIMLQKIM